MSGGSTLYQPNLLSICDRSRESREKETFLSLFSGSNPSLSPLRALFLRLLYYCRGIKPFLLRLALLPLSGRLLAISSIVIELITSVTLYMRVITMLLRFLAFKPLALLELGRQGRILFSSLTRGSNLL